MKILFHSIRAKNFLQIGNDFETFNLQKSPFTVIVGKNGSGKSTLVDMITYALYKKPFRKITLAQLINSTNKKNMLVELAFSVGNSTYVVRRGEKPKVFEIYKDKQLIKADPSITDMQSHLENEIIRQNFKTFCQINVIGKASYKQFMDLSAGERRSVVEDILDSAIYSVMQTLAKSDLKENVDNIRDIERDIQVVSSNIINVKNLIKQYKEDKDNQIQDFQNLINNKKREGDAIFKELKLLQSSLDNLPTLDAQVYNTAKEDLNKLVAERGGYQSTLTRNKSIIDKIDSLDKCPHCLQVVDETHKTHVVQEAQKEVQEANKKIEMINISIENRKEIISREEDRKDKRFRLEQDIESKKTDLLSLKRTIDEYTESINKLKEKSDISNLPDVNVLETKLNNYNSDRDNLVIKSNRLKEAIKLLGDDGIKSHLINKYIPKINASVNEYLSRMNMFVEFNLDSEFNETVKAINRENFTYNSFSEGQKMRIDLAILLTWRRISQMRNSMSTNIFILDEVADGSLDDEGMEEFISILKDVADAQNTFIVSHKDTTADLFDSVIRVETKGNFSRYVHE